MTEDTTIDHVVYMVALEMQEDEALSQPCKTDLMPRRRMSISVESAEVGHLYDKSGTEYTL